MSERMLRRGSYALSKKEMAEYITKQLIDDADKGYGFELSKKTHNLLEKHNPYFLKSLQNSKTIIINSDKEYYTTTLLTGGKEMGYGVYKHDNIIPIEITTTVDESIGKVTDIRLNGGKIETKMILSDELMNQLLTGVKTMEINIKGLTQEQVDSLKKQIEEFERENEKPKEVIDYMNGWVITTDGVSITNVLTNSFINNRYELGLYRDTKEECEKLIKKMKIEHRLRQWAKMCKDKVDWDDSEQDKWVMHYDHEDKKIMNDCYGFCQANNICFTDKSILEKAIADIGEQKLIDEYFVEV